MARFQRRDLMKSLGILAAIVVVVLAAAGIEKEIVDDDHGFHLTVTYTGLGLVQSNHPILGRHWRRAVYLQDVGAVGGGVPRAETVFLGSDAKYCPFETRSLSGRLMAKGLCWVTYEMQYERIPLPDTDDVRSATYFDENSKVISTVDQNGVGTQRYIRDDGALMCEIVTDEHEQRLRWLSNDEWVEATNERRPYTP
ncbi:hypothetical protein GC176_01715 [bacterium]|nr:hypothetical protein [bacterium]